MGAADSEEEALADAQPEPGNRRPRRRRRLILAAIIVLVVLVAYGLTSWYFADRVPRGTTVAGIDIGGLAAEDAEARLTDALGEAQTTGIEVSLGEKETEIDPEEAGLSFDTSATVGRLTGFSLDPRRLVYHLMGGGEQRVVSDVSEDALREELAHAGEAMDQPPVEGEISLDDGEVEVTEGEEGLSLDLDRAIQPVESQWLTANEPIELPGVETTPTITAEAVEAALDDIVDPLQSGPVIIDVDGEDVELTPEDLTALASLPAEDDELVLQIDAEALGDLVLERYPEARSPAEDAQIVLQDGEPSIIESSSGADVDAESLAESVTEAAVVTTESERQVEADIHEVEPDFTTDDAEDLGVTEEVSSFSTPLFHDPPRTENLRVGAGKISDTLIKPGETFSLIEALGPVTGEAGFNSAGVVVDGLETEGMGGGLSQLSTTSFNAGFFAGMELVQFQTHSHHYDRYPAGREATLYTPSVDMQWKNTSPYGVLVDAWVANNEVHVRLWSTEHFDVRSSTSEHENFTDPSTVHHSGSSCVPNNSPEPGFTVTVTRRVLHDGEEIEDNSWTTTYVPWDRVICD